MAEQKKTGQIQIFAKNIRGVASGGILEESKFTRNFAGGRHVQNGRGGGVNNDVNNPRTEPLRVKKVEGPFDPETGEIIKVVEKNKWYEYKVTEFNRDPKKHELQNLKWGVKYDGGNINELKSVSNKGLKEIVHKVLDKNQATQLQIFAYLSEPSNDMSVIAKLERCICDCATPKENFPYSENTFNKIKEISKLIKFYSQKYSVPPIAIAGSIADEYNIINESNSAMFINWLQDDVVINFMPNFAIEFDVYIGGNSKLNNATKHDLGIGNIKLETAKNLYNRYQQEFNAKNWNYKDIVDYIQSNEGTVHLAALVIKRAQELLNQYMLAYCDCKKEAVLVTYYKQGDKYISKFLQNKKRNPNHRIAPGEGCRVSLQREKIFKSLS